MSENRLTDAERQSLDIALDPIGDPARQHHSERVYDAVEAILAARARPAPAPESGLRERVEALRPTWYRGMYGCPDDMYAGADLRAALAAPAPRRLRDAIQPTRSHGAAKEDQR